MEPITHFMFGGCMARAGLNRKSTLATATLVLGAEAADLDIFTEFGGRIFGFEHHRGFSHSFAGVPCVAAFVVLVMWLWYRLRGHRKLKGGKAPPRWGVLFGLACLAGLSHILLDFTNNYGVRPFEPFSYRWYSWDIVFIVEPVLWVILGLGLLLPSLFGLIADEVRSSRRKMPRGRAGAVVALVLVAAFWGMRDYQHRRAIAAMQALTYRGLEPVRVSAFPYYGNPFRWYGVVETELFYQGMIVDSHTPEVDPRGRAQVYWKPPETPVLDNAKGSYLGRVYLGWAQYPVTRVEPLQAPASGYLVRFQDFRFMYPEFAGRGTLGGWVLLDANLNVVGQNFGWRTAPK